MLGKALDYVITNWASMRAAIKTTPLSFAILGLLIFLAAWGVSDRFYNERIAILKERIGSYESKLQVGSPDEAARKLAELEKRLNASLPRALSSVQRQNILGTLANDVG